MNHPKTDLFKETVWATFLSRPNRFLLTASLNGETVQAHCPNPGRLREILLLEPAQLAEENRGVYCIILRVEKEMRIPIGALGPRYFREGYYIYVGSAMANLRQRVARHLRKRKRRHWHIDYLLRYRHRICLKSLMH